MVFRGAKKPAIGLWGVNLAALALYIGITIRLIFSGRLLSG